MELHCRRGCMLSSVAEAVLHDGEVLLRGTGRLGWNVTDVGAVDGGGGRKGCGELTRYWFSATAKFDNSMGR